MELNIINSKNVQINCEEDEESEDYDESDYEVILKNQ